MEIEVGALTGAGHSEQSPDRAMATVIATGKPVPARPSCASPSCTVAATSRGFLEPRQHLLGRPTGLEETQLLMCICLQKVQRQLIYELLYICPRISEEFFGSKRPTTSFAWLLSMTTDASIAVVGYSCRLPGAGNASAYWDLLANRRSAIRRIGADRFPTQRYYHPVPGQPGRSYTFAAGTIDDVWGFDAAAFGISPREAEQMDPQQRHLLE